MNTLIISTFSCTFENYEKTVADFHEKVGHLYVKDYEISNESDHKAHLVLNVINPQAFMGAAGMDCRWDAQKAVRKHYRFGD